MKKRSFFIILCLFISFGIIIGIIDSYVLPIYLTLLPFHGFILMKSIKTRNLPFIIFCIFTFISFGIGSACFFLDRANANSVGFSAIGSFDFSYERLYSAYSYMAVFMITLLIFAFMFKKRKHTNFLPSFIKEQYSVISRLSGSWSLVPITVLVLLFTMVSIWMYNNHIGMIGLHQTALPYHLTGVLFYSRRYVFPLVLIWLFIKTKSKDAATLILVLYSLLNGILATSKSAALIILIPIIYLNYMRNKKIMFYMCSVSAIIIYSIIGDIRQIIYLSDADVSISELASELSNLSFNRNGFLLSLLNNITGRFYGLQSSVLGDQYYSLQFNDLVRYYSGTKMLDIMPEYVEILFGMELPEDKAYGVGLGISGTMQLLSCHKYMYSVIQGAIISVLFCVQNNCIQSIFSNNKVVYKYIALLVLLYFFVEFYNGSTFATTYLGTLLLIIIRFLSFNVAGKKTVVLQNS